MNLLLQNFLVAVLGVNALFWGLMPHKVHCEFVNMFTKSCPSHNIHLLMGVVSFLLAVLVAQWDHLKNVF